MKLYVYTLFVIVLSCTILVAQVPDYYLGIDLSQSNETIKLQLQELITETHHTDIFYTPGVWDALKFTDLDPDQLDHVLLIYGYDDEDGTFNNDRTRHVDLSCHISGCNGLWVREHVYPRSLGTPSLGTEFAGADPHALRAVDSQRNNTRGNRAFGAGSGTSTITSSGAFYPGDEWKGDVARMMMYMHIRYPQQCPADRVGAGTMNFSDFDNMPDIFLIWNAEDPPSQYEITRNDHFETVQGNRNPFIDNPYLATRIWNGPQAIDTWSTTSTTFAQEYDIQVFPTLVKETLYVSGLPENTPFSIYSTTGTLITSGLVNTTLPVLDLHPGMYILHLQIPRKNKAFKFVKVD